MAASLLCACGSESGGEPIESTGDVAQDFSLRSNPNGAWSYGYTTSPGGALTLCASSTRTAWDQDFIHGWYAGIGFDGSPTVAKNTSTESAVFGTADFLPGQLIMHPGPNEETVARFAASRAGQYRVDAVFEGRDFGLGTDTDVHVLVEGGSVFDDAIDGFEDRASYSGTHDLGEGGTIDFVVGNGPDDFRGDSTALDATVVSSDS